jgi:hypothetical protein
MFADAYFIFKTLLISNNLSKVVGEFEPVEGVSDEGIVVRVFTPIGKKDQVRKKPNQTIRLKYSKTGL